jgi:hypothetical protein
MRSSFRDISIVGTSMETFSRGSCDDRLIICLNSCQGFLAREWDLWKQFHHNLKQLLSSRKQNSVSLKFTVISISRCTAPFSSRVWFHSLDYRIFLILFNLAVSTLASGLFWLGAWDVHNCNFGCTKIQKSGRTKILSNVRSPNFLNRWEVSGSVWAKFEYWKGWGWWVHKIWIRWVVWAKFESVVGSSKLESTVCVQKLNTGGVRTKTWILEGVGRPFDKILHYVNCVTRWCVGVELLVWFSNHFLIDVMFVQPAHFDIKCSKNCFSISSSNNKGIMG